MKNKDFPSKFQKFKDALTEESVPVEIFPPRQDENFNTFHHRYFSTAFTNSIWNEYYNNYDEFFFAKYNTSARCATFQSRFN